MNTKAIAAISMVAVMLMASVATIGFATSSADYSVGQGTLTASVDLGKTDTVGENVLVWFAESQYNTAGVDGYTIKWYASALDNSNDDASFETDSEGAPVSGWSQLGSRTVSGGSGNYVPGSSGNAIAVDELLNITLKERTTGSYTLNITNYLNDSQESQVTKINLTVVCTVSVKVGSNSDAVPIDPTYYNITVNLVDDSMTLDSVNLEQFKVYEGDDSWKINGEIGGKGIADSAVGGKVSRSDYFWYAKGLPDGLAMSADGKIIGIPLEVTSPEGEDVNVTAVDQTTGQTYSSTMKVTVTASTSTPTVSIEVTSGQTGIYNEDDVYYVQEKLNSGDDRTFNFTVSTGGGATLINVVSVDSSGKYTTLTASSEAGTSTTYSADFAGTGSYKFFAYAVGGDKIIYDQIQVYVVPAGEGAVNASIVASSTPASG